MEIRVPAEGLRRHTGESYLGLSKVVVVSSIVGDKKTNGGV